MLFVRAHRGRIHEASIIASLLILEGMFLRIVAGICGLVGTDEADIYKCFTIRTSARAYTLTGTLTFSTHPHTRPNQAEEPGEGQRDFECGATVATLLLHSRNPQTQI